MIDGYDAKAIEIVNTHRKRGLATLNIEKMQDHATMKQ